LNGLLYGYSFNTSKKVFQFFTTPKKKKLKYFFHNNQIQQTNMSKPTFRFTFASTTITLLEKFAKEHKEDERKVFKTEWIKWTKENHNIIHQEIRENNNINNVLHKMFESVRYYHRKKKSHPKQPRKKYESLPKTILRHMDTHIGEHIQNNIKPSTSFEHYANQIQILLKNNSQETIEKITEKIKKAYKNRYQKQIQVLQ